MTDRPVSVLRDTTPDIIAEVRALIAAARYGALATLAPADGWPQATRVGLTSFQDQPLILISALAAHTAALRADPRCALLIGEVGKGDPLAHPRASLTCRAVEIPRTDPRAAAARTAYLAALPKAQLYVDLPDFTFMQLAIARVSYNAGFGKAFALSGDDLHDEGPGGD